MAMTELGEYLGRLTAQPAAPSPIGVLLDPVRVQLLTTLFERNDAARRSGNTLSPAAWLEVWGSATHAATALVLAEVERRLREAAQISRYPGRRIPALLPTPEDREVLAARFSAAGTGLELAAESGGDSMRRHAGELERAWDRLVATAGRELGAWESRAGEVRSWRRPWRSLVISATVAAVLALWAGLVLGGYLPVPAFLRPVLDWYWSLPWP